ncbi:MAG: hypothetical protein ABSC94_20460 [Polyangiaceae bacterium]|jgi:hypothetical protein
MMTSFAAHPTLMLVALATSGLLGAVIPTALYLYVEPRGRLYWAREGDTPGTRSAPAIVRLAAWSSFAIGQLAGPGFLVPVACFGLIYLQAKLGIVRPAGLAATAAVGVMAVVQSVLAGRLLPLGIRLLMHDARASANALAAARRNALTSVLVLASGSALGWSMATIPGLIHPWLRAAILWAALRPVLLGAGACLVHAMLLARCAVALTGSRPHSR